MVFCTKMLCSAWDQWCSSPFEQRITTVGHRRQVTAVTRLPRWRQRKTRLEARPLLIMLQDMDRCDFWHANRYCIWLTCYAVPCSKEAGDWGFRGGWLTLQTKFRELVLRCHTDSNAVENAKPRVSQRTTHVWRLGGPSQFWVVRQSAGSKKSIKNDWYSYFLMLSSKCCSQTIRIYGKGFNHAFPWRVTNMAHTMSKHDKTFTVTILRSMFATRTYDISASVDRQSAFIPKHFIPKSNEFIGRRTGHPWQDIESASGFMGRILTASTILNHKYASTSMR